MKEEKEVISTIHNLIETLKDGQEGFKQAAEGVRPAFWVNQNPKPAAVLLAHCTALGLT